MGRVGDESVRNAGPRHWPLLAKVYAGPRPLVFQRVADALAVLAACPQRPKPRKRPLLLSGTQVAKSALRTPDYDSVLVAKFKTEKVWRDE